MKYVDADKIAVALGKMPTWPDFDVRGAAGDAPPPIAYIVAAQMNANAAKIRTRIMFLIGSLEKRK